MQVVRRKVPKLVSVMTQKLGKDLTPFISSYVVMHGRIGELRLYNPEMHGALFALPNFYRELLPAG